MDFDLQLIESITSQVKAAKPNDNGYDIELNNPIKLIAEVKVNIPINNGTRYGSAQKTGIDKDINSLFNGKTKSDINSTTDYYKFMVFLDKPEIREATSYHINSNQDWTGKINIVDNNTSVESTDVVYIVFMSTTDLVLTPL